MRKIEESKCMHCPKCNEVVSIDNCKWADRILVSHKSLKEMNSKLIKDVLDVRNNKNGVIQSLHNQIKKLIDLMDEEQVEKAKALSKSLREEIKRAKKK